MLQLLLFLAAFSAATPPGEGRYLALDEDNEAIGVVDANTVTRDGDRARVMMVAAFASPTASQGEQLWIVQILEEADCAAGKLRHVEYAAFTRDLRLVEHDEGHPSDWDTPPPTTRAERITQYLCAGYSLDDAGPNFLAIAQGYWNRMAPGQRT